MEAGFGETQARFAEMRISPNLGKTAGGEFFTSEPCLAKQ